MRQGTAHFLGSHPRLHPAAALPRQGHVHHVFQIARMSIAALIVAAGRGSRAGGPQPKQWQALAGARVIDHTIAAFRALPQITEIVLVLNADDMDHAGAFTAGGITVTTGGADRAASVQRGLAAIRGARKVLIHDAARPCVSAQILSLIHI